MKIKIPKDVKKILDTLYQNGYEAFIVGGCVRDSILGIEPNDWDIATSAKPDDIIRVFNNYKLIKIGREHGTIGVHMNSVTYEVTTYRVDGDYSDSRHPDSVSFTDRIEDDLSRRDFTVNAMAYNDRVGPRLTERLTSGIRHSDASANPTLALTRTL